MSEATKTPTPMMRQWERIKAQHPDTLLLFRMGDFYELFGEDAATASRECDITLTARDKSSNAVPMCGVPYQRSRALHRAACGKRLSLRHCDQVEDPQIRARIGEARSDARSLAGHTAGRQFFAKRRGSARQQFSGRALCPIKI
jgi:DNA mismatch repair ATPase MutS